MQIKSDKDGLAGRYSNGQHVWTVTKHYLGKGIGARWMIEGPFFSGRYFNHADVMGQIKDWSEVGVTKH
jgi:hypothetical protein